jgi:radical SAM superfamily enzyme YgiQ (UPF0313 family)
MKKLLLINPVEQKREKLNVYFEPLGLGIVAGLTPENWEVKLIDENFEKLEILDVDLVAMTAYTPFVRRAYEIATIFREKNIPVVLGGFHASLLPEEALKFVDTIVIGSAEGAWESLIEDFEKGILKKSYKGSNEFIASPRRDIYSKKYPFASIETQRGCLFSCEFCSVSTVYEHMTVSKPIENVIKEFKEISHKYVFIVDDNMFGNRESDRQRTMEIFNQLIYNKINKKWWVQASVNAIVKNDQLLKLAAKSGCYMFFLGFEAETIDGLKELNKQFNIDNKIVNYDKVIKELHANKITVFGGFIYGLDTDTKDSIIARTERIYKSDIDLPQISVLMPYPGTKIYNRFKNEGRIIKDNYPSDWAFYDYRGITYMPKNLSDKELIEIMKTSYKKLYSIRAIIFRALNTFINTLSLRYAIILLSDNLMYRDVHINKKEPYYRRLLKKYSKHVFRR